MKTRLIRSLCAVAAGAACSASLLGCQASPKREAGAVVSASLEAWPANNLGYEAVSRIAFGSCYDARRDGPEIWDGVNSVDPEVFVFLGDNVYADTDDMKEMRAHYRDLDAVEPFAKLRESATLLATWDDHDYGKNDAGAEFAKRAKSQQVMLDWLVEPEGTRRRVTPGVYDHYVMGPKGQRVQIILLDTRYFRGPLTRGERETRGRSFGIGGRYVIDHANESTLLGEAQWAWFERALEQDADVRIVASSIQVAAEDHRFEKWANLPQERQRLMDVIAQSGAQSVVFISGDRHRAEISRFDPIRAIENSGGAEAEAIGYPLYDITSSALSRSRGGFGNEINRHRVGQQYSDKNFGLITIDWASREVVMAIHNIEGEPVVSAAVGLDELAR